MLTKQVLHQVLRQVRDESFAVRYGEDAAVSYGAGEPRFTVAFHDPRLFDPPYDNLLMRFCRAYMEGGIDVEGDLADLIAMTIRLSSLSSGGTMRTILDTMDRAARFGRRSHRQQKEDIVRHYDLGNDFFRLWLDESMTYSCAYFRTPSDSLEQAQRQKIDHSLRKLRLQPGEELLDIGCGWGALLLRAAEKYGARALGITLSDEQRGAACAAIKARGLEERADARLAHYQEMAREGRRFDKIVSIGMAEHVGKAHLAEFVSALGTLLKPGGLLLLHLITTVQEGPLNDWADRYIFPGAYIPTSAEIIGHFSGRDFHLWDVENLGPHYRLTVDHWSELFEDAATEIRERFGEEFVRMWRLYLRGTSAYFREEVLEVHQILASRGKPTGLPLTREDLYAGI